MAVGNEDIARTPLIMDVERGGDMAAETHALRPPQHEGDSGVDLASRLDTWTAVGPEATVDMPLGATCKLHEKGSDFALLWLLVPRSSAAKTDFRLANGICIIDAGFRGEVRAAMDNVRGETHVLADGQRLVGSSRILCGAAYYLECRPEVG